MNPGGNGESGFRTYSQSAFVGQGVVVETDFVGVLAEESGEEVGEKTAELLTADGIKVVLAIASGFDETGNAEEGEVVADCGLTLAESVAESADVEFAFAEEVHQDAETGFIGEELEDLDEFLFQLGREFGEEVVVSGFFRSFQQL